jgi:hypothetical protein
MFIGKKVADASAIIAFSKKEIFLHCCYAFFT